MILPFVVADLDEELTTRWLHDFESFTSRDRTVEEGIWRRTQGPENSGESGWLSERDARRRVVHYHYKFGLAHVEGICRLAVTSVYLYQSLSLPRHELNEFHDRVIVALAEGGWAEANGEIWTRDTLRCTVRRHIRHPEDEIAGRHMPPGYESFDVRIESAACAMAIHRRRLPWEVLSRGIRRRDARGNPTLVTRLAPLAKFLPFQIELGCGISTEAGIPPLHFLHDLYSVTERETGAFNFGGPSDTLLTEVLSDPEGQIRNRAEMMHACLTAEPTQAHLVLHELAQRRMLLTPIITNNFDGLPARVGLEECYIRRYDEDVPEVPIHPETRSLVVIGSHADRRKVQARFRERGLPVFFLDPEGFLEDGRFTPYPIEGARDGDFVCHAGASAGLLDLGRELGLNVVR